MAKWLMQLLLAAPGCGQLGLPALRWQEACSPRPAWCRTPRGDNCFLLRPGCGQPGLPALRWQAACSPRPGLVQNASRQQLLLAALRLRTTWATRCWQVADNRRSGVGGRRSGVSLEDTPSKRTQVLRCDDLVGDNRARLRPCYLPVVSSVFRHFFWPFVTMLFGSVV